jgi:hypothetical protein
MEWPTDFFYRIGGASACTRRAFAHAQALVPQRVGSGNERLPTASAAVFVSSPGTRSGGQTLARPSRSIVIGGTVAGSAAHFAVFVPSLLVPDLTDAAGPRMVSNSPCLSTVMR